VLIDCAQLPPDHYGGGALYGGAFHGGAFHGGAFHGGAFHGGAFHGALTLCQGRFLLLFYRFICF